MRLSVGPFCFDLICPRLTYALALQYFLDSEKCTVLNKLDASGTQGEGNLSYHWDFGDGNTAEGIIVQHTYEQQGFYLITLTVKTEKGIEDTAYAFASVYPFWENNNPHGQQINISPHIEGLSQQSNTSALSTLSFAKESLTPQQIPDGFVHPDNPDIALLTNHHTIDSYNAGMKVVAYARTYWSEIAYSPGGGFLPYYPDNNLNWNRYGSYETYGRLSCHDDDNDGVLNCGRWWNFSNYSQDYEDGPIGSITLPISPNVKAIHQNLLLNGEFVTLAVHLFQGIRVPRVYVGVFPDHLIPGDVPTPFGANIVDEETNNLIHSIVARESDVLDNKVTIDVPIYAVDGNGDLMTNATGYFGAVFDYEGSHCGDCVMINGQASITVDIPVDSSEAIDLSTVLFGNYGNGTGRFYSPPAKTTTCHSDASHRVEYPVHVEFDNYGRPDDYNGRCVTFTTSSEVPGGLIDPDGDGDDGGGGGPIGLDSLSGGNFQAPTTFNFNNQGMFGFSNVKVLNVEGEIIGTASLDTAQLFRCIVPCAHVWQFYNDQSILIYEFWEDAWKESSMAVQIPLSIVPFLVDSVDIYFYLDDCIVVDIPQNAEAPFSCVIVGAATIALAADAVPAVGTAVGAAMSIANRFLIKSFQLLKKGVGGAFIKAAGTIHRKYAEGGKWLTPGNNFSNWIGYFNDMSAYMGTFIDLLWTNGVRNVGTFIEKADIVATKIMNGLGVGPDVAIVAIKQLDDSVKDAVEQGADPLTHLKLTEFFMDNPCLILEQGLSVQTKCDPERVLDNLKSLYSGVKKMPASFQARFSVDKVSKMMDEFCCDGKEVVPGSERLFKKIFGEAKKAEPDRDSLKGLLAQLEYSAHLRARSYVDLHSIETEVPFGNGVVDYDALWTHSRTQVKYIEEVASTAGRAAKKLNTPQITRLLAYAAEKNYIPRIVVDDPTGLSAATLNQARSMGLKVVDRLGNVLR